MSILSNCPAMKNSYGCTKKTRGHCSGGIEPKARAGFRYQIETTRPQTTAGHGQHLHLWTRGYPRCGRLAQKRWSVWKRKSNLKKVTFEGSRGRCSPPPSLERGNESQWSLAHSIFFPHFLPDAHFTPPPTTSYLRTTRLPTCPLLSNKTLQASSRTPSTSKSTWR